MDGSDTYIQMREQSMIELSYIFLNLKINLDVTGFSKRNLNDRIYPILNRLNLEKKPIVSEFTQSNIMKPLPCKI